MKSTFFAKENNLSLLDFQTFQNIEDKYQTHLIKANGIAIWPYLRIYAFDQLNRGVSTQTQKPQLNYFKNLFWKLPPLSKKKYLIFSSSDQRKLIDYMWFDRADLHEDIRQNGLFVELPSPQHKDKNQMASGSFISKIWFYAIELVLSKFQKVKVEGHDELSKLLKELGVNLNQNYLLKRFFSQLKMSAFAYNLYKPKAIFLTTAYTNMARILAAKQKQIPVFEFQHGLISKKHNAYHIGKHVNPTLQPDYVFSFGEQEIETLSSIRYLSKERVISVGSFYLGALQAKIPLQQNPLKNMFKGKIICCFTAQDMEVEQSIIALNLLATNEKLKVLFLPRKKSISNYYDKGLSKDVTYLAEFDTYHALLYSDFHFTLFSTCTTEAIALGTPSILFNFGGYAQLHFGELANQLSFLSIIENAEQVDSLISKMIDYKPLEVSKSTDFLFKRGYKSNLDFAISSLIK